MQPFEGKIALVTGAGKNIGRAIATRLALDGATVVVNGRSDRAAVDAVVAEIESAGGRAIGYLADVSEPDETQRMLGAIETQFGGLDVLVSNAGLRRRTAFMEMDFAQWREILSVALDGAFLLAKHAVPLMITRGGGAIIALSGISTHVGTPHRCHVSASKAGLEGLIRALAVELAPHGIRCNSIAPGAIDTIRGVSAGQSPGTINDSTIPLGRKGRVEEIANTVAFLAGPGGGYITGQTIHVNGGAYLS